MSRVFKSFTVPKELDKWFGASNEMEARDGGSYRNADGNKGSVRKVRPDKALVLSWDAAGFAEGSQVEVLFQPKADACGIVVNHTRVMTRHEADEVRAMWGEALDRLKSNLEDVDASRRIAPRYPCISAWVENRINCSRF